MSYADYWNDLMALFDSDAVGRDNMITDLRLYSEIVYQIYTRTVEFKNEAGVSREEMEQALTEIEERVASMYIGDDSQAMQLTADISANIERARKNIAAAFDTNSNSLGSADAEEGGVGA